MILAGKSRATSQKASRPLETRHEDSIPFILKETHRAFVRSLEGALNRHGLSSSQWYVLRTLWTEEGLTQAELSQRIGLMTPTTVATLNQMERMDLIERVEHPRDKRKYRIVLTAKSRRIKTQLLTRAREVLDQALDGIEADKIEVVRNVLNTIRTNLS